MEFQPIEGLKPVWLKDAAAQETQKASPMPFADIFQAAVDNVRETDAQKNEMEYLLATGQLDNPAEVMVALTRASLSVDLLVEMRNKALDAYNNVMQINL